MSAQLLGLIAAFIAGSFTAIGWFVTSRRQDTAKRREVALLYLQRQIEELYGPLFGLLCESKTVYDVARKVLPMRETRRLAIERFSREDTALWEHILDRFLRPLNLRMAELIRVKMHLLADGTLPASFSLYLEHAAHSEALHSARTARSMQLLESWVPFPQDFPEDVRRSLHGLLVRYRFELRERSPVSQQGAGAPTSSIAGTTPLGPSSDALGVAPGSVPARHS